MAVMNCCAGRCNEGPARSQGANTEKGAPHVQICIGFCDVNDDDDNDDGALHGDR